METPNRLANPNEHVLLQTEIQSVALTPLGQGTLVVIPVLVCIVPAPVNIRMGFSF